MKKFIKILVPFLVLSSITLTGCKKDKKEEPKKVALTFGDMHAENVTQITNKRLSNLIKAEESFLFVVSSPTCGCWSNFRPNIEKYVKDNKLVCYQMSYKDFGDIAYTYGVTGLSESTTTFFIFENGQIKHQLNSSKEEKTMNSYDAFKDFMDKNVEKPGCYYINASDITTIKESNKNAVIYFERNSCDDCSAANKTILKNYVLNHKSMNKLYVIDCQDIWKSSDDPGYDDYLNAKNLYGMAEPANPYGFGSGVFPFFSYIKESNYESGCVLYNDSLEKIDNNSFKIINTYYTSERIATLHYNVPEVLLNKVLIKPDVIENAGGYAYWDQEKANSFYGTVLNSFLDYALPNVTYTF